MTYPPFTFQVWLIRSPVRSNNQASRIFVRGFVVYLVSQNWTGISLQLRPVLGISLEANDILNLFLNTIMVYHTRIPVLVDQSVVYTKAARLLAEPERTRTTQPTTLSSNLLLNGCTQIELKYPYVRKIEFNYSVPHCKKT